MTSHMAHGGNSIALMPVLNDNTPRARSPECHPVQVEDSPTQDSDDSSEYPEIIANYTQLTGYDESFDELTKRQAYDLLNLSGCYYSKLSMQEARLKLKKSAALNLSCKSCRNILISNFL